MPFIGAMIVITILLKFGDYIWRFIEIIFTPLYWLSRILPGIDDIITFFTRPIYWIGKLIDPYLSSLSSTTPVVVIAMFVLTVLFFMLKRKREYLTAATVEIYMKLTTTFICSAIILGMMIVAGGHELSGYSMACYTTIPFSLEDVSVLDGNTKTIIMVTILGIFFLSILFFITKGFRSVVRTWVGIALCITLGYNFMTFRFWFIKNVTNGLLASAFNLVEVVVFLGAFFGFAALILPKGAIRALNQLNYARRMRDTTVSHSSDSPSIVMKKVPSYVTDDDGNSYPVELRGDFLYIRGNNGELSTKWEYIKDYSYFSIDSQHFHMHFTEEAEFDD